jgi:hypothetical protein
LIETGTASRTSFDQRDAFAELSGANGGDIATGTTTQHQYIHSGCNISDNHMKKLLC